MNDEKNSIKHPGGVVPFFETSAKIGDNVMDVFEYIFETFGTTISCLSDNNKNSWCRP